MPETKVQMQQQIQINDLAKDIDTIKNNHLVHMAEDIDELKANVKENREHFNGRMDRLDNRIFWVLGLTVSTLVSIIASMVV